MIVKVSVIVLIASVILLYWILTDVQKEVDKNLEEESDVHNLRTTEKT